MTVPVGKRNVPDTVANSYLIAGAKARELALHTIRICANEKYFLPQYRLSLTADLVKTAKDIYLNTCTANDIMVKSAEDWNRREALQKEAISLCGRMRYLISMARALFHLRAGKTGFWIGLLEDTRALLSSWHEKDRERYRNKFNGM